MRFMYDSVNAWGIPLSAEYVAGYGDGARFRWSNAAWERFRGKGSKTRLYVITVTGDMLADIGDVETGDMTDQDAANWVKRMHSAGFTPTLYASGSRWEGLDATVQSQAPGLGYYRVLSDPTGRPHRWSEHPNAIVQYFFGKTGTYDLSAIFNDKWDGALTGHKK
jgi:hypothetical protein